MKPNKESSISSDAHTLEQSKKPSIIVSMKDKFFRALSGVMNSPETKDFIARFNENPRKIAEQNPEKFIKNYSALKHLPEAQKLALEIIQKLLNKGFLMVILQNYNKIKDVPGAKEAIEEAMRSYEIDPEYILCKYEAIKNAPGAEDLRQKAIDMLLEKNPTYFVEYYSAIKNVPGTKEACQKVIPMVLKENPQLIRKNYWQIKDVPGAKEAFEQAVKATKQ